MELTDVDTIEIGVMSSNQPECASSENFRVIGSSWQENELEPNSSIEKCKQVKVLLDSSSIPQGLLESYILASKSETQVVPVGAVPKSFEEYSQPKYALIEPILTGLIEKIELLDYQREYVLNLTNYNVYFHHTTGYKYQMFHKGEAIDMKSSQQILSTKISQPRVTQHQYSINDECSMISYLCLHCFHVTGHYSSLCTHFKTH